MRYSKAFMLRKAFYLLCWLTLEVQMKKKILIVDDEEGIRFSLEGILEDEGYETFCAEHSEQALDILSKNDIALIILDIWLSDTGSHEQRDTDDGLFFLKQLKQKEEYKTIPVIMISGHGTIETAVSALKLGAYDFLEKPLALDSVLNTVQRAFEVAELKRENTVLKKELVSHKLEKTLVGTSEPMLKFKSALCAVAPTAVWVLITGENGTGKEVAARAIHNISPRANKPFVAINCAAIPDELIESELFGHEKGSFTGAESRIGKFELAHQGTLFLDEVGDMSLKTQAKILRILQEQSFERVGGNKTLQVDVRVIAATNKDLEKGMQEGSFRSDLYYRLRGFPLHLPPLRERSDDIPLLINALSQEMYKTGLTAPLFSQNALTFLKGSQWKGNIRELKHILEQVTILYPETLVEPEMLTFLLSSPQSNSPTTKSMEASREGRSTAVALEEVTSGTLFTPLLSKLLTLDYKTAKSEFELWYLEEKLKEADNNVTKLAELVGLERS